MSEVELTQVSHEVCEQQFEVISRLKSRIPELVIEPDREWLWTKNQKVEYREILREEGFTWSRNRKQWYWRPEQKKSAKASKSKTGKVDDSQDLLKTIMKMAGDARTAFRVAKERYAEENYKTPQYEVRQHVNILDDNSPVKKVWPIADLCGFAWIRMSGGKGKIVKDIQKLGKKISDKVWEITDGKEKIQLRRGEYSKQYSLDIEGTESYGNCAFGSVKAGMAAALDVVRRFYPDDETKKWVEANLD